MVAAVRVHKPGGPEVLTYEDVEIAAPGQGQIKIKQHAAGVNFIDAYFRAGMYPSPVGMPFIAGNESAGEVMAVGPGVTNAQGRRSGCLCRPAWRLCGRSGWCRRDRAVKLPDNISYEQAAGMMLKGMTVAVPAQPHIQGREGHRVPDPRGRGRRRPDCMPVGEPPRRHCHRDRRLEGEGRTRQEEWLSPHHPLSRRGFRGEGEGDYRRQALRRRLRRHRQDHVSGLARLPASAWLFRVSFGSASGQIDAFNINILQTKGSLFATRPTLNNYVAKRDDLIATAADLFKVVGSRRGENSDQPEILVQGSPPGRTREMEGRDTTGSSILVP